MNILPVQTNNLYNLKSKRNMSARYSSINFGSNKVLSKSLLSGFATLLGIDIIFKEEFIRSKKEVQQKRLENLRREYFTLSLDMLLPIHTAGRIEERRIKNQFKEYPKDLIILYTTIGQYGDEPSRLVTNIVERNDISVIPELIDACNSIDGGVNDYWSSLEKDLVEALSYSNTRLSPEKKEKLNTYLKQIRENVAIFEEDFRNKL